MRSQCTSSMFSAVSTLTAKQTRAQLATRTSLPADRQDDPRKTPQLRRLVNQLIIKLGYCGVYALPEGTVSMGTSSKCRRVSSCTNTEKALLTPLLKSSRIFCIQPLNMPPQSAPCSLHIFASQVSRNHLQSFFCAGVRPVPKEAMRSSTSYRSFCSATLPPRGLPCPSDSGV